MTPDERTAIFLRNTAWHDPRFERPTKAAFWEFEAATDRATLLAEVDALNEIITWMKTHDRERAITPYPEDDIKAERARILAAVKDLRVSPTGPRDENAWQIGFRQSRNETVSAVLDIIEHDQSTATNDQVGHKTTK